MKNIGHDSSKPALWALPGPDCAVN
jgi:hypothetical protein